MNKKWITFHKTRSALGSSILLASAGRAHAAETYNPVALPPGSYTFDIVVENSVPAALPYCLNATAGGGTALTDNSFFEQGLYGRFGQTNGNIGIPLHGSAFTMISNANLQVIMPPD